MSCLPFPLSLVSCKDVIHILPDGRTCFGELCWILDFFVSLGKWSSGTIS